MKQEYFYNNKGNKVKTTTYKSDGSFDFEFICNYDAQGNKTEENRIYYDTLFNSKSIYTYSRNEIREDRYDEGILKVKYRTIYNDKGDVVEENSYSVESKYSAARTNKTNYQFEYDKNRNWIKQISFEDGKSKFISEREVKYF